MNPALAAILHSNAAELERLFQACHVEWADLFGSATGADFDPERSDIDILISFQQAYFPGIAEAFFTLASGLERIFERPVDLLTDRSIRSPYLRQSINARRIRIHGN